MKLNEVIFDLGIKGSRSHKSYEVMVANWYAEENNPIPSLELCQSTWLNTSLPRLTAQRKQERVQEVKLQANEILRLNHDWKVAKQFTTSYWTEEEFEAIKAEMQDVRDRSNEIELEILALETFDEVNQYVIDFEGV
jgi:hypothetical protein